jgi:hypothetical protein
VSSGNELIFLIYFVFFAEELLFEREKFKYISADLDQTLTDLTGY